MSSEPGELVGFGDSYRFPGNDRYTEQVVDLAATPGPPLAMRFGMLAIADPWWPEVAPEHAVIALGKGVHPTTLTTVGRTGEGNGEPEQVAVAATIGRLDEVAVWRPLVQNEKHFHLEVDSGLGAFYEITDAAVLQPLFEDGEHMKVVAQRTLVELVAPMAAQDRDVAVVFSCPNGPDLYPAYAGFDAYTKAVAVLVDLGVLGVAERVSRQTPAPRR